MKSEEMTTRDRRIYARGRYEGAILIGDKAQEETWKEHVEFWEKRRALYMRKSGIFNESRSDYFELERLLGLAWQCVLDAQFAYDSLEEAVEDFHQELLIRLDRHECNKAQAIKEAKHGLLN